MKENTQTAGFALPIILVTMGAMLVIMVTVLNLNLLSIQNSQRSLASSQFRLLIGQINTLLKNADSCSTAVASHSQMITTTGDPADFNIYSTASSSATPLIGAGQQYADLTITKLQIKVVRTLTTAQSDPSKNVIENPQSFATKSILAILRNSSLFEALIPQAQAQQAQGPFPTATSVATQTVAPTATIRGSPTATAIPGPTTAPTSTSTYAATPTSPASSSPTASSGPSSSPTSSSPPVPGVPGVYLGQIMVSAIASGSRGTGGFSPITYYSEELYLTFSIGADGTVATCSSLNFRPDPDIFSATNMSVIPSCGPRQFLYSNGTQLTCVTMVCNPYNEVLTGFNGTDGSAICSPTTTPSSSSLPSGGPSSSSSPSSYPSSSSSPSSYPSSSSSPSSYPSSSSSPSSYPSSSSSPSSYPSSSSSPSSNPSSSSLPTTSPSSLGTPTFLPSVTSSPTPTGSPIPIPTISLNKVKRYPDPEPHKAQPHFTRAPSEKIESASLQLSDGKKEC